MPETLKRKLRGTFSKKDLQRRETAKMIYNTLKDHEVGVYNEEPGLTKISNEDYAEGEKMPWEEFGLEL